jgi:hypothetical protein
MGYIFETEIEQIKNVVRARTIGEAESITLHEIVIAPVPPAIKAYFRAEVERCLREERLREIRSKKFPYSNPEVVSLQHQQDLLLMVHYQFNQHEFDTLLDQAVHFTFNFLCRPQFTLVEFLFENQRHMSTSAIEQKLDYCPDYEYYSVLLKRYFAERGLTEISYEDFKSLLRKIDAEVVAQHTSLELAGMTRPIIGFVEAIRDEEGGRGAMRKLPINAAVVFFEDKNLSEIKLRLEYERDHNKLAEIELSQLARIIEDVRTITSEHPVERVVATPDEADQPPPPVAPEQVTVAAPVGGNGVSVGGEKTSTAIEESLKVVPEESDLVPEPKRQEPGSDRSSPIASMFSRAEEKRILKLIFHKDRDEYDATLSALDRAGSWKEASLILDDLFLARDVSPQSTVAILLTEKTYERYAQAKQ